ncbi:BCCT family transporter [Polycladidibacter hongkongensis]|uniref:BCCT family transporter n=1 Tax=Polycladidibacter hongkongensis TaxID=1647556 RepID=UPI00082F2069|nr:BCCT family transporter [Pseudovibrio hongkongensis]
MTNSSDVEAIPAPEGPTAVIDTDYEIGQDNINPQIGRVELDIHNPVFAISGALLVAFVAITLAFHDSLGPIFGDLRSFLTSNFAGFFLTAGNIFVLVCLGIVLSPLGRVRIGGANASADYSYLSWFAMLFAAGMGIGLVFYGVSEPISHFSTSFSGSDWAPLGGAAGNEAEAMRLGMAATIFHWGLHPWAVYAIVGLSLALFAYNKGLPLTIRSVFYPIFGERIWGWPGHLIDILAVFATMSGLATSLGIGAEQANAGLNYLFGIEVTNTSRVILIIAITSIALASVVAGLDAGVKLLSEINMVAAAVLLLFVLIAGPTALVVSGFFNNLLAYVEYLPALSNPIGRTDTNFMEGWTSFYWAWWISWSPFVGMFIARISRGRTVREFITCVLLIPSLVSIIWMTTFGETAITLVVHEGVSSIKDAALELKLFSMLAELPLTLFTSITGIFLVVIFFVTSSDSGSLVIDTMTAGGKVNTPTPQRVFWVIIGALAAIALLLGGGLTALQAVSVSTGFPFAIVLLLACYSLVTGLYVERKTHLSEYEGKL